MQSWSSNKFGHTWNASFIPSLPFLPPLSMKIIGYKPLVRSHSSSTSTPAWPHRSNSHNKTALNCINGVWMLWREKEDLGVRLKTHMAAKLIGTNLCWMSVCFPSCCTFSSLYFCLFFLCSVENVEAFEALSKSNVITENSNCGSRNDINLPENVSPLKRGLFSENLRILRVSNGYLDMNLSFREINYTMMRHEWKQYEVNRAQ